MIINQKPNINKKNKTQWNDAYRIGRGRVATLRFEENHHWPRHQHHLPTCRQPPRRAGRSTASPDWSWIAVWCRRCTHSGGLVLYLVLVLLLCCWLPSRHPRRLPKVCWRLAASGNRGELWIGRLHGCCSGCCCSFHQYPLDRTPTTTGKQATTTFAARKTTLTEYICYNKLTWSIGCGKPKCRKQKKKNYTHIIEWEQSICQ